MGSFLDHTRRVDDVECRPAAPKDFASVQRIQGVSLSKEVWTHYLGEHSQAIVATGIDYERERRRSIVGFLVTCEWNALRGSGEKNFEEPLVCVASDIENPGEVEELLRSAFPLDPISDFQE